jgi:hypothetical protein
MHLGMLVVTPGQRVPILENDTAPYGPTAIAKLDADHTPTPAVAAQARALGRQVAEVTTWLAWGRATWAARV